MAYSLEKQERYAEAIENYKQALQFKPDFAEAYNHLGVVLNTQERSAEALENYKHALQLDPDYTEVHWNLSLVLLRTGRLTEAWKEYEWRRNPELGMTTYPHCYEIPRWDGSCFTSKRLLVHYEQGLGDTLHFVRYLPMVKARGGTVILEVRKPMYRVLQSFPGVDELIEASSDNKPAVKFDYHVSLMDLPKIFATTLETIPTEVPYIHACPTKVEYWRKKLASTDLKVGIVWAGSSMHGKDRYRSCTLKCFAPLAEVDGVRLYGLQKGEAAAQMDELAETMPVINISNEFEDFADTAAAIENLDIVVSVDTAVLHLASAMGKPALALLSISPDWRWMLSRRDSPWYPTMKLFRQKERGQWGPVFQRVAEELQMMAAKHRIGNHKLNYGQEKTIPAIQDYKNNGTQHYQAGHLNQAEKLCREVLQSNPNHPEALHLLGAIAYQNKQYSMAIELIGKAIAANQRIPQFHNTIGAALRAIGKFEEAIAAYKQAVLLRPDYAEAYNNMANAFSAQGRYADAVEKYNQVVSLNPDNVEAYNSMAVALQYQGKYTAALEKCNRALSLKPDYVEAYNTIASVLLKKGLYAEAIENYRQTLRLNPDYAEAHTNLGMALLLNERFEEGWAEYQWRLSDEKAFHLHHYQSPCWDGSSFAGRRLLVHYEQGFGDNIQFIRYLPMVKARGGTVLCEMLKPLIGLWRGFPGIDELIEASSNSKPAVKFDFHVPLLELPRIFGTTLETIPAEVPYLHADSTKAEYWRQRIAGTSFKVGIVWAGKPAHSEDSNRSCRLQHFAPLAKIPGVRLYSLQKGPAAGQISELPGTMTVKNPGEEFEDFTDTAAAIENLDLVISVDTAVLHLAGAMGKPAWAILPFTPDWRWMLNRQDSPWYPTMKLFRQKKRGQWEPVFQRVAEELRIMAAKSQKSEVGSRKSEDGSRKLDSRNQKPESVFCPLSSVLCSQMIPAIIPYYKNKNQLEKCIAHLKKQTVEVETFIRDNSNDNIYFTAAVNEGIKKYLSQPCEYILVLNQDMYLEPTAVEKMTAFMNSHPECGIGAPLHLYADDPDYVIFAGGYESFPFGKHQHGRLSEFTEDEQILWCNGACMILRKEMIQEIGLLDENFVLLGSDSDYCFTARSRGWQVWRIAGARGIHEYGVSGVSADADIEILKTKDMIHFGKKWLTGELYKKMAYEGKSYTPEIIARFMNQLRDAKSRLESCHPSMLDA